MPAVRKQTHEMCQELADPTFGSKLNLTAGAALTAWQSTLQAKILVQRTTKLQKHNVVEVDDQQK